MTADLPPEPQGALILVVDDYDDGRDMICTYLRHAGFRTAEARDGAEAITQAIALEPALILMDLSMPVLDGWEATRRLRLDPRTAAIPVVALSGQALDDETASAREAGCEALVSKPYLPTDVLQHVRALLLAKP